MSQLFNLRRAMQAVATLARALVSQRFFKTGKGQYGEGDVFIGITVPDCREIARSFSDLSFEDIDKLLASKIHEERLIALLILVRRFQKGDAKEQAKIFKHYLASTKRINNWDLVDLSADKIVGAYLLDKPKDILFKLVKSKNIWERRIAIIATFYFIKNKQFDTTLAIAEELLDDTHDLIHKAVGWMLREVGKRSLVVERVFLDKHAHYMPRTMLRYAIERFDPVMRTKYMAIKKPQD